MKLPAHIHALLEAGPEFPYGSKEIHDWALRITLDTAEDCAAQCDARADLSYPNPNTARISARIDAHAIRARYGLDHLEKDK